VFDEHFQQSQQLWKQRSKKRWQIDWGDFAAAVAEAQTARAVWVGRRQEAHQPRGPTPLAAAGAARHRWPSRGPPR
jgi:hypothetical protein